MTRISLLHCKNRPCNNSTVFTFLIFTHTKIYVSNSMKIDSISQLLIHIELIVTSLSYLLSIFSVFITPVKSEKLESIIRNITFFFQKMPLAISIALSQYKGAIFKPF